MKTKFKLLFILVLCYFGSYSQQSVIIEDSINIDEFKDNIEEQIDSVASDTIRKAYLYTIDSSDYPYKPITSLNDTLSKLKNSKEYWYVNAVFDDKKPTTNISNDSNSGWLKFFQSSAFKIIIWALIIGVAITIIFLFLNENQISFFKRKSKAIADTTITDIQEENIFETNFTDRIEKAKLANDLATATRLHYLHVLLLLHQNGFIEYTKERTNFDYLMSLINSSFYKDFASATRNYEFVWYGDFELTKEQFNIIETVFINLKNKIQLK